MTLDIVAIYVRKGAGNPLDHELVICPTTTKLLEHGLLAANVVKGGESGGAKITTKRALHSHVKVLGIGARGFLGAHLVDGGVNLIPLAWAMEAMATTVVAIGVENGGKGLEAAGFDDSPSGFDV